LSVLFSQPTINGASLFQAAALDTTNVMLAWTTPSGLAPIGYYVTVLQLGTLPNGSAGYLPAGTYATAKNSLAVPFLTAGNSYVFLISSRVNAGGNIELSPLRVQLPVAHATLSTLGRPSAPLACRIASL